MALSTSERAAYGYKGRAAGLTKSINTGAIERGFAEQQRRVESDAAIERDFAKTLGNLYDYDLIKPLGEDLLNDVNGLRERYENGEITMNEVYMDINNIKKKGKEYEYYSKQYKAAADPESGEYIIDPVTGEYLTGAKKLGYLAPEFTSGADDVQNVIDKALTLTVGKAPEKSSSELAMTIGKNIFENFAKDKKLSPDALSYYETIGGITNMYQLERLKELDPNVRELYDETLKTDPKFQAASKYEYNTMSPEDRGKFDDVGGLSVYQGEVGGRAYKEQEREVSTITAQDYNAKTAIDKANDDEEEQPANPYKTYSPSQEEDIRVEVESTLKKNPDYTWVFKGRDLTSKTATAENIETFRNKLKAARERGDKKIDFEGATFDITTENSEGKNRADAFIETYDNTLREARNKFKETDLSAMAYPLRVKEYKVTRDGKEYTLNNPEVVKDGDDYYIRGGVDASVSTKTGSGARVSQDIGLEKLYKLNANEIEKLDKSGMLPSEGKTGEEIKPSEKAKGL